MSKYLKKFETMSQYNAYTADTENFIKPNVSLIAETRVVAYNPTQPTPAETRVVATFNVTDTSNPTKIGYNQYTSGFSAIEIDGVETAVTSAYTFDTLGEHTVKYTLTDPTSIGEHAFWSCSGLTSIDIPNSVTYIGDSAFQYCSGLTSCTIGSGVTSIDSSAFQYCSGLTSIDIPSGVTSIGERAFNSCRSLTSIDIPNSVISIGEQAFYNCSSITSIVIPDSVTSIGTSAFEYCSNLTSCTIGSGVTSIGQGAFYQCSGLTTCTIGSGVTSIGNSAFRDCTSLTSITSNAVTAPTIKGYTFCNVKTGGTLTVPSGSSGYDTWMGTGNYYLGKYNWTKVEQ